MSARPHVVVLYHYQRPDDVVSARLYDDLCEGLAVRGWEVEARPSNRSCHDPGASYSLEPEHRNGVTFRRVWRPPLRQGSSVGRVLNATWLVSRWLSDLATRRRAPDVVIVGTDPVLAVSLAGPLRRLRPRTRIAHWVFDVYPEAAVADGVLAPRAALASTLARAARSGYRACDLIVDLGPRMRERLEAHPSSARRVTIPPWALLEPDGMASPDAATRAALFGEDVALGLLHSGSFGRAHDSDQLAALAARLAGTRVRVCFAGRGHRIDALRARARGAIRVADFCAEQELERRLTAADVHLVSLRREWSGLVVPSKFFGALAAGRPVVFAGPATSDLGRWIRDFQVGWVMDPERPGDVEDVALDLLRLSDAPARRDELRRRCRAVYDERFARRVALTRWHEALAPLVAR